MIGALSGIGLLFACWQLAVGLPSLALSHLQARSELLQGFAFRIVLLWSALCVLAATLVVATNRALLAAILAHSVLNIPLAILGAGVLIALAVRIVRKVLEPRLLTGSKVSEEVYRAIHDSMLDAADSLELKHLPRLAVHSAGVTPAVSGAFRTLLLAPEYLADLEPEQRHLVLAHELAHIKRRHLLWCGVASVLSLLQNPFRQRSALTDATRHWAEEEADAVLRTLEFVPEQVRQARQTVLLQMRPEMVLAEVGFAEKDARSAGATGWFPQLGASSSLLLSGFAATGPLIAIGPTVHPSWYLSEIDAAFLRGELAGHFSDSVGDYYRRRYDIVFTENGRLTRMRGDGSGAQTLTRKSMFEPNVSRDGTTIVAVSPGQGNADLYVMDGGGQYQRQLTQTPGIDEREPKLSPDGKFIAYCAIPWDRDANEYRFNQSQIHIYDLTDNSDRNLSTTLGPGIEVSFGHDGEYILYMIGGRVFRANKDGTGKRQLTWGKSGDEPGSQEDHYPCSNFDGSLISFNRTYYLEPKDWNYGVPSDAANRSYTTGVWIMKADGSAPRMATQPRCGKLEQSGARFSPFGSWIAYMETETIKDAPSQTIWESDLMTGDKRCLFEGEGIWWPSYTGLLR